MFESGFIHIRMIEIEGDHTREDDDEGDNQLHKRREDKTLLTFAKALRAKGALNNILVQTPVVEIRDPNAKDQSRDWKNQVPFRKIHAQFIGVKSLETIHRAAGEALYKITKLGSSLDQTSALSKNDRIRATQLTHREI